MTAPTETVELPTELKRNAFDAMCRAWSYCPTDMPHLDRMRWMGEYVASALSRSPVVGAVGGEPTDTQRLDWLDATNTRFRMGWKVGMAPAGNVSVQSVIQLGTGPLTTIREAIDAAKEAAK